MCPRQIFVPVSSRKKNQNEAHWMLQWLIIQNVLYGVKISTVFRMYYKQLFFEG